MEIKNINLVNGEGANLSINKMPEGYGQIEAFRKAVESGLNLLAQGAAQPQVAEIYLGNPGDSGYVDRPVQAVYMGSYATLFSNNRYDLHIWLHRSHDGKLQASSTYGARDDRSTCGFLADRGWARLGLSDDYLQLAERLLDEVSSSSKIAA